MPFLGLSIESVTFALVAALAACSSLANIGVRAAQKMQNA